MAFTDKEKKALREGLADVVNDDRRVTEKLSDAVARSDAAATTNVIGTTTDLTGVDGTGNNAADLTTTESRLDAIEAKIDELINALKTSE